MRNLFRGLSLALVAAVVLTAHSLAFANVKVGEKAPDFTLVDSNGKSVKLSAYAGKTVVLEWFNKGCPYVKKHYESKNMQALQKAYTDKGIIWLTVISSAPKKQGYETPEEANKTRAEWAIASTATLLDTKGEVGRTYGAKTTPHMYVVDPKGMLAYNGAIDSISSSDAADIPKSVNYVSGALDLVAAGKPVTTASTKPYGCSVKY
ncbi:MAG: thioredoxin family protein [Bdellovibrionales bacterium]|nr:thioredoxin family protein [Bdellovibrionales bacterium]